jgi:CP family cyanate transporter-like MFS transporter
MTIDKARTFTLTYSIVAFLLLAANLRPALTGVGPVLGEIRSSLGLSGTAAGVLGALPVLIFAGFSPLARRAEAFGIERTLGGCLALMAAGIALRSQGSVAALFGGTVILSLGIAVANVLIPGLIKRDYPHRIEGMTTAYLMAMSLTGAVASGIAAPLSARLPGGWQSSLAVWAVFAALSLLCWLPEVRKAAAPAEEEKPNSGTKPLLRSPLAWQIAVFMGLHSLFYYVLIAWIPAYLDDQGVPPAESGLCLTLFQLLSFAVGFAAPRLLRRARDHRPLAVVPSTVTALCVFGLIAAPRWAGLWLAISGCSVGITFILAFALIGMRTADHRQAAALSAMAQSVGYLIAATGPIMFGRLHDLTAGWMVPMAGFLAVTVAQVAMGLGAGRPGKV